jgi:hypothetical protein
MYDDFFKHLKIQTNAAFNLYHTAKVIHLRVLQTSIGLSQTLPGNPQSTIRNLKFLHFSLDFSFCLLYSVFYSSHPKLCLCLASPYLASPYRALPLLCFAVQYSALPRFAFALLCSTILRIRIALQYVSMPCPA